MQARAHPAQGDVAMPTLELSRIPRVRRARAAPREVTVEPPAPVRTSAVRAAEEASNEERTVTIESPSRVRIAGR